MILMKYISTKEVSGKWGISDRRIRVLCNEGRIEGAIKIGRNWSIPADAIKPMDAREVIKKNYSGLEFDFSYIDSLKESIDKYRPLSKRLADSLHEKLVVEWTYNSNAIEGNTLTLSETKAVLEGITIGGKSMIEHLETINHREVILFVEDLISKKEPLSPIIIKNEDRAKYYDVLDLAHTTMNYEPFIKLVSELVIESEKLWLSVLE